MVRPVPFEAQRAMIPLDGSNTTSPIQYAIRATQRMQAMTLVWMRVEAAASAA
jgi:hypothetical protein